MGSYAQVPPLAYRGGGLATQSEGSSTSDEEKRRSGSAERYPSSPEHQSRSTGSMVCNLCVCVCDKFESGKGHHVQTYDNHYIIKIYIVRPSVCP